MGHKRNEMVGSGNGNEPHSRLNVYCGLDSELKNELWNEMGERESVCKGVEGVQKSTKMRCL